MARYIKAVECADIISERFNIPLGDLVDVFAEIPTADVVPKRDIVDEIFGEIEKHYCINKFGEVYVHFDSIEEIKKKYKGEV